MTEELEAMTEADYLALDGDRRCPWCRSANCEWVDDPDPGFDYLHCNDCDKAWREIMDVIELQLLDRNLEPIAFSFEW